MTNEYNGWTNRETWNANLWLSSEYTLYQAVESLANTHGSDHEQLASEIEDLARLTWPAQTTPDGADFSDVNWLEIATDWRA